jgi:hypothetical protein
VEGIQRCGKPNRCFDDARRCTCVVERRKVVTRQTSPPSFPQACARVEDVSPRERVGTYQQVQQPAAHGWHSEPNGVGAVT